MNKSGADNHAGTEVPSRPKEPLEPDDKAVLKIVTRSLLPIFTFGCVGVGLSFLDDPTHIERATRGKAAGHEYDKKGDGVHADIVFVSDLFVRSALWM